MEVEEVIFVSSFIVEGEVMVYVLVEVLCLCGIKVMCLVCGVLVGSELEYVDLGMIVYVLFD